MFNSRVFDCMNVLNTAASAAADRTKVITNNIANASTPNYKRKDLAFEAVLQSALNNGDIEHMNFGDRMNRLNQNLSVLKPVSYTDHKNLSYRMDGNNVDPDIENTYLAQSQIRYNTLIDQTNHEFSRLKTVLSIS